MEVALNSDQPHRVIYYSSGPNNSTRVFHNLEKAEEFTNGLKPGKLILIQLASEKPNLPEAKSKQRLMQRNTNKNKCSCGRGKFIADESCSACKGDLFHFNRS